MDLELDEITLIERSLKGDKQAFESLFVRYKSVILQMLVNYTGNEFDSNDLLQETFIKAFLNLHRYDSRYTFAQWIRTIARNTFIDYARRKGVKSPILLLDSVPMQDYSPENPENLIIGREWQAEIERELNALPEDYRQIIELRYYMGYSYDEIAEELSLPMGTVKNRLFRAKGLLNKILKKYRQP